MITVIWIYFLSSNVALIFVIMDHLKFTMSYQYSSNFLSPCGYQTLGLFSIVDRANLIHRIRVLLFIDFLISQV